MKDLEIKEVPLGKIKLVKLDPWNDKHVDVARELNDDTAKAMCFDMEKLVDSERMYGGSGNSFLMKDQEKDDYVGYMYISNRFDDGSRILSSIVSERVRGMGYGKVSLTSVSDFLLKYGLAEEVQLYIKRDNHGAAKVAIDCGFVKDSEDGEPQLFTRRK